MIYVSSACVRNSSIRESVSQLVGEGYTNIELSGGTKYYDHILEDLLSLKKEHNLNYLIHNYFPPPTEDFVLNLASLDKEVSEKSLDHCKKAIDWSVQLGAKKFSFHAGFLFNIPLHQVGKKITKVELFDEAKAYEEFASKLNDLHNYSNGRVDLYVENNVVSAGNFERFEETDPFFFTSTENFKKIVSPSSFKPLIDVAHLKVSCNTLNLDFKENFSTLLNSTDYIHISDNNGKNDQNKGLKFESELYQILKEFWSPNKTVSLEVYDGLDSLRESYEAIKEINS